MRLVDTVPVVHDGEYRLWSTRGDYRARMNRETLETLQGMGPKGPGELDRAERHLYERLAEKGRMEEGEGEMDLRGREGLYTVAVESIDACNFRCRHCYLGRKEGDVLDLDTYREVVDDARGMGVFGVALTGGEVFLDDHLFDRIEYAREKDMRVSLTTNASLVDDEGAERLASLGVDPVAVTLNGFEEHHEKLYPTGSWEPTVESIERLVEAGNDVHLNYNIYDFNQDALEEFEDFARDLGVAGIRANPVKAAGWGEDMEQELVHDGPMCCGRGGDEEVTIKADGRVVPCVFLEDDEMGNVYEERLPEIYGRYGSS